MKYKLFLIIISLISVHSLAQEIKEPNSFWAIYEPYTLQFIPNGVDTIEFLKGVIQDSNSVHYKYESAAEYLVLKNDANLRQFLIDNMNNYPHKSSGWDSLRVLDISWDRYFTDQYIKGFLGIESAIQGMDSVARFHPNRLERIVAVRLLSHIGRLDYFDFIKSCYLTGLDQNIDGFLSEYGKDDRYTNEVKELLTNTIQDSTERLKIWAATSLLAAIDKPYAISILEDKFRTTTGEDRYFNYFVDLGRLDPEGQMDRTIYAMENEQADSIRELFLPSYNSDPSYNGDPGYYSPYFIKFMEQLINNGFNTYDIESFLYTFKPYPFDSTSTVLENIDYATNLLDTVSFYIWLGDLQFKNELQSILHSAKTNLQNGDSLACRSEIKSFQDTVDFVYADSLNPDPRFVTLEGWKFLYWNAQYILDRLPEPQQNPNLLVTLQNSQGVQIPASNVKYYDTSWKDAVDNGDGTFTVITTKPNVSVRMFYEYANQTVNNIPAQNNTYTFHTVNTQVELENSSGQLIDEGIVQYYAGAWRDFGTTVNGVASKELLPDNYSFRMTYEYGSNDKQQDVSSNATVIFQTVNAAVQLQNSTGSLIDQGTVQYYAGAWRSFGTTVNGVVNKELLSNNYSFRMTYEYVSTDKQQDLNTNPTVTFSTVLCTVQVKDQQNQPVNNADVKYYSGAWREIGLTNSNGEITKELLPANLSFRAALGTVHQDVQQDLSVNNIVQIQLPISN